LKNTWRTLMMEAASSSKMLVFASLHSEVPQYYSRILKVETATCSDTLLRIIQSRRLQISEALKVQTFYVDTSERFVISFIIYTLFI
jgi:hypothetical protein